MKRKSFFILIISTLVLVFVASAIAMAQGPTSNEVNVPVGNAFTYQGQLKDASGLVTGTCDFQLSLWNDLANGTQVGSTLTQTDIAVSEGLFTVQLDFGANAFNGSARWLSIAVSCPSGSGSYTPLSPRQPLTPAPYASYAVAAGSANTAGSASTADYATTAGSATTADSTDYATNAGDADTLDGLHADALKQHYQNLVVVAKSGGDFNTITDALNSITTNSAANPYTIYVAPGIYSERVVMKPYVDIEGAGEVATKITYIGSSYWITGTVVGADNAELRFLTVENTGGYAFATAIYNDHASPRLTHVTAVAAGGTANSTCVDNEYSSPEMTDMTVSAAGTSINLGVFNYGPSSPVMTNITASASGGTNNNGVANDWYSSPKMVGVTTTASGGTDNYGVKSVPWSSPTMIDVIASASGGTNSYGVYNETTLPITMTNVTASASGGTNNYGVYNKSSSPKIMNLTASASGGTNNYGMWNDSSSLTISNSVINASDGTNDGLHNIAASGTFTIKINNSQISASTSTIYQDSHYTTKVGASQLAGGGAFGGTYVCLASYSGSYAALNSSCQP